LEKVGYKYFDSMFSLLDDFYTDFYSSFSLVFYFEEAIDLKSLVFGRSEGEVNTFATLNFFLRFFGFISCTLTQFLFSPRGDVNFGVASQLI